MINECNEILRRNKNIILLIESEDWIIYSDNYEDMDLIRVINELSGELRIIIVLFYFEDMSIKSIVRILEILEGIVRLRFMRVWIKFREVMSEV